MDITELMKTQTPYYSQHGQIPQELQLKAKTLCWQYNQTSPAEGEKKEKF